MKTLMCGFSDCGYDGYEINEKTGYITKIFGPQVAILEVGMLIHIFHDCDNYWICGFSVGKHDFRVLIIDDRSRKDIDAFFEQSVPMGIPVRIEIITSIGLHRFANPFLNL